MEKLKNKIFWTVFFILTLSIVSFVLVFNIKNYFDKKSSIINSLNVATSNIRNSEVGSKDGKIDEPRKLSNDTKVEKNVPDVNDLNRDVKFIDSVIYTVLIDEDNSIKEIINHSNNDSQIINVNLTINNILKNNNIEKRHIGCLYFEKYSYTYSKGNYLILFDNSAINSELKSYLLISLLLFGAIEIIVYFVTRKITVWIVEPVKLNFNKQREFVSDASHELKTPLSVIIASCEAFEKNPNEKKWLDNIKSEAYRMNLLVVNLLELAVSEHKETYKFESKDLSKIVELSVLTFEGRAFENNIKINYEIDENINFCVDENSVKQLMEILLDNAIKHSQKESTINVYLKKEKRKIELRVENTGDGIPKGEEENIFERFYRVDKVRNIKEGRYGLGLAIAKNIVLKHNAKIYANSSNGITTFKIIFK